MKFKTLSVIMPVYNEAETIAKIIEKVQNVKLNGIKKEIVVVNDSSKDESEKIIFKTMQKYSNIIYFKHVKNKGKGAAVRTGFKHSKGDLLVVQDGDLEYNPDEFKKLVLPILKGECNVVYGSRILGKIRGFKISSHYYGNLFLSFITRLLYGQNITDMETCYKMMTREVITGLNLKSNKFDIEPEITAKIIKKGYFIKEVPITYNSRSFEEGKKITWKDGLKALYVLCKYRLSN